MSWRAQISRNIQEIRIVVCPTSESSRGMRDFVSWNYAELKMLNPTMPFIYREGTNDKPFIYARYDWNVEKLVDVDNKSTDQITDILKNLVEYGYTLPKSPESDIYHRQPIIDAEIGEQGYTAINVTWDGKTVRKNPYIKPELSEIMQFLPSSDVRESIDKMK